MSTSQGRQILEESQYLEVVYGLVEGSHFFVCLFVWVFLFFCFCRFTLRAWAVPLEVQEGWNAHRSFLLFLVRGTREGTQGSQSFQRVGRESQKGEDERCRTPPSVWTPATSRAQPGITHEQNKLESVWTEGRGTTYHRADSLQFEENPVSCLLKRKYQHSEGAPYSWKRDASRGCFEHCSANIC